MSQVNFSWISKSQKLPTSKGRSHNSKTSQILLAVFYSGRYLETTILKAYFHNISKYLLLICH